MHLRLFRKVCVDPGADLTAESAEKTQKHTEKKKEKRKKGSESALTRISRKTQKDTKEFLKIKKLLCHPCFFVLFVFPFRSGSVRFQCLPW